MTTIRDVAKHAKVSVATVSRVLNKKGYVSKEAEEAVLQAIKELNYQPSSVARSLYHKTSGMIGLLIPDISNPFFPELARAVEDVASTYGYTVVLCNTDEEIEKERKYLQALKQKYVDGVILTTSFLPYKEYEQLNIPMVALDRYVNENIPLVASQNKAGARLATEHLLEQGCQFIAHIRGPKGVTPAEDRYEGFKEVVEEQEVANIVVSADFHIDEAQKVTKALLETHPTIDGIFASSDVVAAGAMKAAHMMGKRIPDDLQIVGFDGIPLGNMLVPSLTTVEQPIYDLGAVSTRLLIKQIEKKALDTYRYEIPTKLVVRETTKGGENSENAEHYRCR
ncbi:LacI family DNA-binding transcriptional regulator [Halalkalibacterium halodurans]|uniref:LacI family DNA-binding transcriptional regulator n=1 Tax=Halalkalibacterium halodurans TaxID=86665 RepID=UPI002AA9FB3B|nr:LacI family DNA-binding transcriptional regulator [Halalkalibacterium halodurans]MDY7224232.1 LacI family DNA-binding transcriptional regulator [Halalkalibacterium halodurans]MDY7243517.1 LacI family DNA-binding transcriptional regulator [Halalkalibacterium halodurans]